jgi:hypothetical protein
MCDSFIRWLIVTSGDSVDLKDAFVALASVAVVVWTGALVLRQIRDAPSTWTLVGAMDLLQSSFVAALLALGVPSITYRPGGLIIVLLYLLAYGNTLVKFIPSRLAQKPDEYKEKFKAKGSGVFYIISIIIFFVGVTAIIVSPTSQSIFLVSFFWFIIGSQAIYTGLHSA